MWLKHNRAISLLGVLWKERFPFGKKGNGMVNKKSKGKLLGFHINFGDKV